MLYGTYQPELPEVPAVYGVKRPVHTWNPYIINFTHLWLMVCDAWRTSNYWDKLRIWFMPTGWRPADVIERYPVNAVKDMSSFRKFSPQYSAFFTAWAVVQLTVTLGLLSFLFYRAESISNNEKLLYGGFLLAAIFAYTAVMDKRTYGVVAMFAVVALAIAIIVNTGDWFGLSALWQTGPIVFIAFWAVSALAGVFFLFTEFNTGNEMSVSRD